MILNTSEKVIKYLIRSGIASTADEPLVECLNGGVSSSVWKILLTNNRWVIKQALAKLKVEEDWFSDVERIHREHEVMEALYHFIPGGAIPKVLHVDYINHIYMMECAEEEARTWKEILMEGNMSLAVAQNAAILLRELHHQSNSMNDSEKAKFHDQKYFIQLRIDPFHRRLMQKYPELSSSIQKLIDELTVQKTCLVHGDFSPKNILVSNDSKIVLIDFEVAHWGNPVFDLAYCIGHLMLKGWHLKKHNESLKLIEIFLDGYNNQVNNLLPHLGLMLLARMDGKSQVSYITEDNMKNEIRKVGINWIQNKIVGTNVLENIQKVFQTEQ